jgi:hypothetical protein
VGISNDLKDDTIPQSLSFPTIKCTCGSEILLVLDVKAMNEAIENHVAEHQKKNGLSWTKQKVSRDNLIIQTFELAAKVENK